MPVRKSEKLKKPSLSEQLAGTAGSITSYTGAGSITSFAGAGSITSSLDLEVTMDKDSVRAKKLFFFYLLFFCHFQIVSQLRSPQLR